MTIIIKCCFSKKQQSHVINAFVDKIYSQMAYGGKLFLLLLIKIYTYLLFINNSTRISASQNWFCNYWAVPSLKYDLVTHIANQRENNEIINDL